MFSFLIFLDSQTKKLKTKEIQLQVRCLRSEKKLGLEFKRGMKLEVESRVKAEVMKRNSRRTLSGALERNELRIESPEYLESLGCNSLPYLS